MTLAARLVGLSCLSLAMLAVFVAMPREAFSEDKVAMYKIDFDDLDGETKLDDGDIIKVTVSERPEALGRAENICYVELRTQKKMWWKGIVMHPKGKDYVKVVEVTDSTQLSQNEVFDTDFDKRFTLSKAKGLGVHTNVYEITDFKDHLEPNKIYRFTWISD
ncbi:hypothetical protein [Stratiformator vulcanicus]|uniref:Uncharacterized protein n=1 Tax=Stratiformator vulcanicus TaxID=2527980 RepID=A0A517R7M5_9PLAN|nr:hypothetical protein [Stratiformator vulcanicus]QDT39886.1 hypothetical protein Pan189_42980 [Stratiformator vulcanicus]